MHQRREVPPLRSGLTCVKIDGANVAVEVKTGTGALVYGADFTECIANLNKLIKQNPLMVWVWEDEETPMVMRVRDLLEGLEGYNGKVDIGWCSTTVQSARTDSTASASRTTRAARS